MALVRVRVQVRVQVGVEVKVRVGVIGLGFGLGSNPLYPGMSLSRMSTCLHRLSRDGGPPQMETRAWPRTPP